MKWTEMSEQERNAFVAEKVFGRAINREMTWGRLLMQREGQPGLTEEIPAYTTDMNTAWLVVRRMNNPNSPAYPDYQDYARFIDELVKVVGSDMLFDLFYCDHDGDHLTPERICLAALRALDVEL